MRHVELRQRSWFAALNLIAEKLAARGNTPLAFSHLVSVEQLKLICRKNSLRDSATSWLRTTALTLFLAHDPARRRRTQEEIQEQLDQLIRAFKRLTYMINRIGVVIEWELDVYVEEIGPKRGQLSYYRTADPHLEMFKRNLDTFLQRAQAIRLPKSEPGRKIALSTLALDLLATHLRKAKPKASSRDLARLAQDLFDPLLPPKLPPPLWHQRARKEWPRVPSPHFNQPENKGN
jgi:hypothetical protein